MNTRNLIILTVLIALAAAWFYHTQGDVQPPVQIKASELEYEASDITAVQTNEQGETEYQLTAESLVYNPQTNQDEMSGITMNWQPTSQQHYRIRAGKATLNQQTGDMVLSNGFELVSMTGSSDALSEGSQSQQAEQSQRQTGSADQSMSSPTAATPSQPVVPSITVVGSTLTGNTKQRKIYSEDAVKVTQGSNSFEAATMRANLETGDYEFGQIAVSFTPSQRQDKSLF